MSSSQSNKLGQIYVEWDIKTQILRYVSACSVARNSNCTMYTLCIALGMDFRIHVLLWSSTDTFPHKKYPQGNKNKSQNFSLNEIINAFAFFKK